MMDLFSLQIENKIFFISWNSFICTKVTLENNLNESAHMSPFSSALLIDGTSLRNHLQTLK